MEKHIDLFSPEYLRDIGISNSMENANGAIENWTEKAYLFLVNYAKTNNEFMAEDVRLASSGIVEQPPSNRAWGGIFVRAVKSGLIKKNGYRNVKNAKAHCTPATVWKVS
jgi:hypothetical protein